jgi:hypothetical protein
MSINWKKIFNIALIALVVLGVIGIIVGLLSRTSWGQILLIIGACIVSIIVVYFIVRYLLNLFAPGFISGMTEEKDKLGIKGKQNQYDFSKIIESPETQVKTKEYCNILNALEKSKNTELYNKLLNIYPNDKAALIKMVDSYKMDQDKYKIK